MSNIFKAFRTGFKEGKEKAKIEAEARRIGSGVNVIVFEPTGEIKLATWNDGPICKKNLTAFRQCPQEILDIIPSEVFSFCKQFITPHYLFLQKGEDGKIRWASTGEPEPVKF